MVGSKSNFAAHFTILGEQFLPLTKGKVTVSLIVGESGIRHSADTASSPGIYRLALVPKIAGKGKLVFDIETESYTDQIVIDNFTVYADEHSALDSQKDPCPDNKRQPRCGINFGTAAALRHKFWHAASHASMIHIEYKG